MDKPSQLIAKAETYNLYFRGDANAEARRLYQKAIALDPQRAQAYAELAYAELTAWLYNWDPGIKDLEQALSYANQAVAIDGDDYYNHWILADVHLYRKDFGLAADTYDLVRAKAATQAIEEEQRAINVDWADMLLLTGKTKQAIALVQDAISQSSLPERWFYWVLGWALYADGQYEQSLAALRTLGNPRNAIRKNVIANLIQLRRGDEAAAEAKQYLEEEQARGVTFAAEGEDVWPNMQIIEDRVPFAEDSKRSMWKGHMCGAFEHCKCPHPPTKGA
jgi:tetratricopeptide (TPR) repeat protein